MHMYELVVREHEMRVAISLARFARRNAVAERVDVESNSGVSGDSDGGGGYVLFAAARRAVGRRRGTRDRR